MLCNYSFEESDIIFSQCYERSFQNSKRVKWVIQHNNEFRIGFKCVCVCVHSIFQIYAYVGRGMKRERERGSKEGEGMRERMKSKNKRRSDWLMIEKGRPSPLWAATLVCRSPCPGSQASHENKPVSKLHSPMAFASISAFPSLFLLDLLPYCPLGTKCNL